MREQMMNISPIPAALRAQLAALQPPSGHGVWPFGAPAVDACLPGGGLPLGVLHEVSAMGIDVEAGASGAGFLACLVGAIARGREVFWIGPAVADLHPPGLLTYGLDPGRLVMVETRDDDASLAAMEAVLRAGGAGAVVGEVGRLGRVAARRLQLACLKHGTTGFVLRRWPHGRKPMAEEPIAAVTRWEIAPAPTAIIAGTPGPARWRVRLVHARGGFEGGWIMQAREGDHDGPHPLRMVAGLAAAAAAPDAGRTRSAS